MFATNQPLFQPTRWSVVAAIRQAPIEQSQAALETLCRIYWYPLYAYCRSRGHSPEDAKDLTQSFFERVIERNFFEKALPEKGRLRTFLLNSFQNFLTNEWRRGQTQRRGLGLKPLSFDAAQAEDWFASEPADRLSPEALYHRRWSLMTLDSALSRLSENYDEDGKSPLFAELKIFLEDDASPEAQQVIADRLGITIGALRIAVFRLRKHHREILFEEVSRSLNASTEAEVREELGRLIAAL